MRLLVLLASLHVLARLPHSTAVARFLRRGARAARETVTLTERLRVLVLARSYPSAVLPGLGLWTEDPTVRLADQFDVQVVAPVPWCPAACPCWAVSSSTRASVACRSSDRRSGIEVVRPRFVVGLGTTLYPFEARAYAAGSTER